MNTSILRPSEQFSAELRALYHAWGYESYKVNRFEEYDLYMRNKSFLTDEHVLTFTDTDGKLMALKPDITLSIVKNANEKDFPLRICYAESVYRVPRGSVGFREITQTGVEYLGPVQAWNQVEMLLMAAQSLAVLSDHWSLDVSDMGIVASILSGEVLTGEERSRILGCIRSKSLHELRSACSQFGVSPATQELLEVLVTVSGPLLPTLDQMEKYPLPGACHEVLKVLRRAGEAAEAVGLLHLRLDFSVVNDMSYYNGLTFTGFIEGIPSSVLSGGRYDPVLARMGKTGQAIGFAVYLDQVDRLSHIKKEEETICVMTESGDPVETARRAFSGIASGKRMAWVSGGEDA